MTFTQIVILAVIQGLAELLPVSSSAHVIAAAKLMHLKADSPEFTLLLVMLHTGTMFAVIVYFWGAWKKAFFSSREKFVRFANRIIVATIVTGVIGMGLKIAIEKYLKHTHPERAGEIEELFSNLELVAVALAGAGLLILISGLYSGRRGGPIAFPSPIQSRSAPSRACPSPSAASPAQARQFPWASFAAWPGSNSKSIASP